jgi:predicted DNA-binding transcriptional regulator AlpA
MKRKHFTKRRNKAAAVGEIYLNRREVAKKLNLCIETIKRMEQRKQLFPIHLNSRVVRYRMSEIEKVMHDLEQAANIGEQK